MGIENNKEDRIIDREEMKCREKKIQDGGDDHKRNICIEATF